MDCVKCLELGLKSTIKSGESWKSTAYRYPFPDGDNRIHHHLIEIIKQDHFCNQGHSFETVQRTYCWCGWPDNKEFD